MSTSGSSPPAHRDRAVTSIVDLTRDQDGRIHARLLDVTLGRSGPVYAAWIRAHHHVGITVRDLDATIAWYEKHLGFKQLTEFGFQARAWRSSGAVGDPPHVP